MIRALSDTVVLKAAEKPTLSPGGLHLPESAKDREPVGLFEVVTVRHDLDSGFYTGSRVFVSHEDVKRRGAVFFCFVSDVLAVDDPDEAPEDEDNGEDSETAT